MQTYEERIAAIQADVIGFEWHSMIINGERCFSVNCKRDHVWDIMSEEHCGMPTCAIRRDGSKFFITNCHYDQKGKCIRLTAGISSTFTVIER